MKKVMIAVWLMVFVLFGVYAWFFLHYNKPETKPAVKETVSSAEAEDNTVCISVSAVGDCTLGVDINGLGGGSFDDVFEKNGKSYSYFFENVKNLFENDDLTIVNFEGSLSENGEREDKEYAFRGNPLYAKILTAGAVEAANLANNHSMDYGAQAYEDTKKALKENGVSSFGKSEYKVIDIKGVKVGLIGTSLLTYAERVAFQGVMEKLKAENPDIIIASFHWGEENAEEPDQSQIQFAHLAIDSGADLVLGHHPHILQAIEKYKGKYIAYSLGNFCFGGNRSPKDKDTMIFGYKFYFKDGERLFDKEEASIIPCSVSSVSDRNNFKPTPLGGDEYERVKRKIIDRSSGFTGIEDIRFIKG